MKTKKIFWIPCAVIALLLVILITVPLFFKGKIISVVNEQLEKNLNTEASVSDISLSLLRHFPYLSVRISDILIMGKDTTAGDTLLSVKSVDLSANLISLIKMKNIEIRRIGIDQPRIHAVMSKDGHANWEIFPAGDTTAVKPEETAPEEFKTRIALRLFKIADASIRYDDHKTGMSASLENLDFGLSGNLSQAFSAIKIDSECERLNFGMAGIRYLNDVRLGMHFDVDADLENSVFKLNENHVSLNELVLNFTGDVKTLESGDMETHVQFATGSTDLRTLLSLVPAIYKNDFTALKTAGLMKLEGNIDGKMTKTTTPDAEVKLLVQNASFSYPGLPKSAENIQVDVRVRYDGTQMDKSTVDVSRFTLDLGGNPVDLVLSLRTPVSDPSVSGKLSASVDLATLQDVIPLKDTRISGLIRAALGWNGNLSSIEKQRFGDFHADGSVEVTNFNYSGPDMTESLSLSAALKFSPAYAEMTSLNATMGSSDFKVTGRLSGYLPYLFKKGILKGELSLIADKIDLNEFMTAQKPAGDVPADTAMLRVVQVPANIDFRFTSAIRHLIYGKIEAENVQGLIVAKDGRIVMENLSMNTLDGILKLSGEYNTQNIKNPLVNLAMDASGIDIPKGFAAVDLLGKLAPIASSATGKFSLGFAFTSLLNENMTLVLNTIRGDGNLGSKQIGIQNSRPFKAVGQALKTSALDNLILKNVNMKFNIQDGRLRVDPFKTHTNDIAMTIGGEHTFDNNLDYSIDLSAPRKLLGLDNAAIDGLYSKAASLGLSIEKSDTVNMRVKLTGPITSPQVSIDLKQTASAVVGEVKEAAKEVIDTKTEETKQKAREEADRIIGEAEQLAVKIREEGKNAADLVRTQSNANADKLIQAAKNPISKLIAEQAAKKLRQEGLDKALQIEREADNRAGSLVQDARVRADNLLK